MNVVCGSAREAKQHLPRAPAAKSGTGALVPRASAAACTAGGGLKALLGGRRDPEVYRAAQPKKAICAASGDPAHEGPCQQGGGVTDTGRCQPISAEWCQNHLHPCHRGRGRRPGVTTGPRMRPLRAPLTPVPAARSFRRLRASPPGNRERRERMLRKHLEKSRVAPVPAPACPSPKVASEGEATAVSPGKQSPALVSVAQPFPRGARAQTKGAKGQHRAPATRSAAR